MTPEELLRLHMEKVAEDVDLMAEATKKILGKNTLRGAFMKIRATRMKEFAADLRLWINFDNLSDVKDVV